MVRFKLPKPPELWQMYARAYSSSTVQVDRTGFESEEGMLLGLVAFLETHCLKPGDRVLDFGAGTGRFAAMLRTLGVAVDGVELAEEARREAHARYGFDFKYDLSELSKASYDWVTAIEVLEHLIEPENALKQLWKLLKPGGGLFLTTPNAGGLAARIYGNQWREAINPFHLVLFTHPALKAVLARVGYERIWPVTFSPIGGVSTYRGMLHRMLQLLNLYGGLRVVARRPLG
jgi:2-polyprenyl-3-methyl-5-hydroxy-6-metoxy-1,4-benzoquinol methylase